MRQVYEHYTREDRKVWRLLFDRQYPKLEKSASSAHLKGLEMIGFRADYIPNFSKINTVLKRKTDWQLAVVPGIVPDYTFFELMAHKHFPATTWLRKLSELDYLEEPDMFHDVFAHVPLLANKYFAAFLKAISEIGLSYCGNEWAIERIARIYWFSVEFGLIQEKEELKIYGAGILSSAGETEYSVSKTPPKYPFNISEMMDTPFRKDIFQDRYFVVDSYDQLYSSIPQIRSFLETRAPQLQHA